MHLRRGARTEHVSRRHHHPNHCTMHYHHASKEAKNHTDAEPPMGRVPAPSPPTQPVRQYEKAPLPNPHHAAVRVLWTQGRARWRGPSRQPPALHHRKHPPMLRSVQLHEARSRPSRFRGRCWGHRERPHVFVREVGRHDRQEGPRPLPCESLKVKRGGDFISCVR